MALVIQGGTQLAATLKGLSKRVSKKIMKDALGKAAEPIRAKAARTAPRAAPQPDMADNINIDAVRGKGASVAVGPAPGFEYAFYQEFGTEHHSAQPFMRPAMSEAQTAMDLLSRLLWAALISRGVAGARGAGQGSSESFAGPSAPIVTGGPSGGLL